MEMGNGNPDRLALAALSSAARFEHDPCLTRDVLRIQRFQKLVLRDSGLLEKADQCSPLQFSVIGYDATRRTTTHDDMAAPPARDSEPQTLQCLHDLGTRDHRELRHVPSRETT